MCVYIEHENKFGSCRLNVDQLDQSWVYFSEVHAAESVAYLNRALVRLQDIWEEIGIPEEQRLQRTNEVHKHIKVGPTSTPV